MQVTSEEFYNYSRGHLPIRLVIPAAIAAAVATGTLLLLFSPIAAPFVLAIACGVFVGFNILGMVLNSLANRLYRLDEVNQSVPADAVQAVGKANFFSSKEQALEKLAAKRAIGPMMLFAAVLSVTVITPLILLSPLAPWLIAVIGISVFVGFFAVESLYSFFSNRVNFLFGLAPYSQDKVDYSTFRGLFGDQLYIRSTFVVALILGGVSALLMLAYTSLVIGVVLGISGGLAAFITITGLGISAVNPEKTTSNFTPILWKCFFAFIISCAMVITFASLGILSPGALAGLFFACVAGILEVELLIYFLIDKKIDLSIFSIICSMLVGLAMAAIAFGFGLIPAGVAFIVAASVFVFSPLFLLLFNVGLNKISLIITNHDVSQFKQDVFNIVLSSIFCGLSAGLFLGLLHFAVIPTVIIALTATIMPTVLTLGFAIPKNMIPVLGSPQSTQPLLGNSADNTALSGPPAADSRSPPATTQVQLTKGTDRDDDVDDFDTGNDRALAVDAGATSPESNPLYDL